MPYFFKKIGGNNMLSSEVKMYLPYQSKISLKRWKNTNHWFMVNLIIHPDAIGK
jgi:hypothetical protein